MPYNDGTGGGEIKSAVDAGMLVGQVRKPEDGAIPFVIRPKDATIESLERLLPTPVTLEAHETLHDPASFATYCKLYRRDGSIIFFDADDMRFRAVLDYHDPAIEDATNTSTTVVGPAPQWCRHAAIYTVRKTPEWEAWVGINKRQMAQRDFARFLEDHSDDVGDNYGNTLLKIAYTLELKAELRVANTEIDPSNGSIKCTYEENVESKAAGGSIIVPPGFNLSIVPFEGGPKVTLSCRLRHRRVDHGIQFWIEMFKLEQAIKGALAEVRKGIETATGILVLAGD